LIFPERHGLFHALGQQYDIAMLNGLLLHLLIALCEALDSSDRIVDKVVDQIFVRNLLLINHLASEAHYHLAVIDKAGLHDLRELRDQRFLFEEQVVRAFLRIDKDASHGLEEVVEDLFEVWRRFQGRRVRENVAIENLQEELNIYR